MFLIKFDYVIFNFNFSLSDHELVWKYVDLVLAKEPVAGVKVCC